MSRHLMQASSVLIVLLIPAVQSSVGNLLAVNGGPRMTHKLWGISYPALQQWQHAAACTT